MDVSAAHDVMPRRISEVGGFDADVDVVVVGGGCAGLAAAIEAAAGGLEVMIVERSGGHGGASAMSGGLIYLGGGTALQRACGVEDSPEEMYKFLMAATGPGPDEAKVAIYCDESAAHFDWLVSCGVPFKASLYRGNRPEPETDDGLMYSGGEDAHPWCDLAKPAPRAHIPELRDKRPRERSGGWLLMHHLIATARSAGVTDMLDTAVQRLVVDDDGEVCGVVARQYGADRTIRARKGVVLSAGGFAFNDDMLAAHAPQLLGLEKLGTEGDDGRAIRMAQAVGAGVQHMDASECAYGATSGLIAPSIVVNGHGQRFINEDAYFGRVGQAVLFGEGGDSVVVFDETVWDNTTEGERWGLQPTAVAATIEELESDVGLPTGALQSTVELYNHHAAAGEDPVFRKRSRWLRPLQAPFAAIDMRGRRGLMVFTLGGLQTTVDGEVRHVSGAPIPGLYAAGRTTSGIPAAGYLSGSSLGDGTFFGRRAGRAATCR